MSHVINKIERPAKEIIEKFRQIGTATIHEASGRRGGVNPAIRPASRGVRLCGPAFTVQCHPKDNLMLHKALERAQPGDVIVATVGDYHEGGYFGGLMATSAVARQLGGLAIDGCIRDSEEIVEMGFPVFCRGFCIWGTAKNVLGLVNHPAIFGGVMVHPGDLIVGDDDGLVIVDRKESASVLEKSLQRVDAEKKKAEILRAGVSSVEFNKLDKVFASLGLVEE